MKLNKIFLIVFLFFIGQCLGTIVDLSSYEKRLISQNGEDGVLQKIFSLIGTTNQYYVEFGAGNGHFSSNTKYFREKYGWRGLLLDGACSNNMQNNLAMNLYKEFITAENICMVFEKYEVPYEFDLISIDIDRNDFYVWKALSKYYKPRVVVIECNSLFNFDDDKVIRYSAHGEWDGTHYLGASVLALFNLGRYLGYSLVYEESKGVNLFFIRDDVLDSTKVQFKNQNFVAQIYQTSQLKAFLDPKIIAKKFTTSSEILNK